MEAHTTNPMGFSSSESNDAISRRVSVPNIPLMVVVTDVDSEKPGNRETSSKVVADSPRSLVSIFQLFG